MISSQGVHDRFGGVVPEIASRQHLELVDAVVDEALARAGATLDDVDLVAATRGPGLVGALLVGFAPPRRSRPRASCRSRRSTISTATSAAQLSRAGARVRAAVRLR